MYSQVGCFVNGVKTGRVFVTIDRDYDGDKIDVSPTALSH